MDRGGAGEAVHRHTHARTESPRCDGTDSAAVNEWIYAGGKYRPHKGKEPGHSEFILYIFVLTSVCYWKLLV